MNYFFYKPTNTKPQGFTLVEMIVVLGLFSFIMTLATSVLYSTQAINVKLQATQAVLDNVNVSLETMARDIRYGSNFYCVDSVPDVSVDVNYLNRRDCNYAGHGGKVLIFRPIDAIGLNDRVAYYLESTPAGGAIYKDEYIKDESTLIVTKNHYQNTADDVKINSLVFYVTGASSTAMNDYAQPLITTTVFGETIPIKSGATSTPFTIQTSISSRVLDN
jgi:prepilin-type N-terminal cleavage/methylation domain-containing protein